VGPRGAPEEAMQKQQQAASMQAAAQAPKKVDGTETRPGEETQGTQPSESDDSQDSDHYVADEDTEAAAAAAAAQKAATTAANAATAAQKAATTAAEEATAAAAQKAATTAAEAAAAAVPEEAVAPQESAPSPQESTKPQYNWEAATKLLAWLKTENIEQQAKWLRDREQRQAFGGKKKKHGEVMFDTVGAFNTAFGQKDGQDPARHLEKAKKMEKKIRDNYETFRQAYDDELNLSFIMF